MATPQFDMSRFILAGALGTGAVFLLTQFQPPANDPVKAPPPVIQTKQDKEPAYESSSDEDDLVFEVTQLRKEKAQFIVRIKGVDAVDECIAMFRKDKQAARDMFLKWAGTKPELRGFELVRANYSDELILSYTSQKGGRPVKVAHKQLLALENVRYADLDDLVTIEEEK